MFFVVYPTHLAVSPGGGEQADAGSPLSRAGALHAATGPGGKGGRPSGSRFIHQPGRALLKESLAPLADDLARDREAGGNFVIAAALSGQEDNLGPEN
jgi:hypothetical protein